MRLTFEYKDTRLYCTAYRGGSCRSDHYIGRIEMSFVESGISKIIVYDGNIDNVVGYIHSSEMFRNPVDWRNNVKEVPIVPETMSAHKLMKLFMQQKKRLL